MKYLLVITKKQIDLPVIVKELSMALKEVRLLALDQTNDPTVEEVVIKIHPTYHTKNMQSDIIERFSCGAKALNRLFGC